MFSKLWKSIIARDTRGLTTVEYVVVLCLIVGLSVAVWNTFGKSVKSKLSESSSAFEENVVTK